MNIMMLASAWPSNVEGWITLITLIVGLIGAIAALIPTIIKMVKALRELIKNKQWQKIIELAISAMKEAEGLFQEGTDKLEYAMKTVKAACKELNIALDDTLMVNLEKYIRDLISWHNDMNDASKEISVPKITSKQAKKPSKREYLVQENIEDVNK